MDIYLCFQIRSNFCFYVDVSAFMPLIMVYISGKVEITSIGNSILSNPAFVGTSLFSYSSLFIYFLKIISY